MFDAYPQQRISYAKVLLPLSLMAMLCLVLYAVFESSVEDSRPDEDPSMKRMRPFLSSQSFEIGLWTRQKGATSSEPALHKGASQEVEELREELERARARTQEQAAELTRLRGTGKTTPLNAEEDDEEASSSTNPSKAPEIPASLWRQPPDTFPETSTMNVKETVKETVKDTKDSTITVKTGDKEISIQIAQDVSKNSNTSALRGTGDTVDEGADVSTTQMATTLRSNATDAKFSDGKDGTLITVRSGQQSIVIQVRDGEQVTTSLPSTTLMADNATSAVESLVKALPDLPELPPEPKKIEETKVSMDVALDKGDKVEEKKSTEVEAALASTTKGFSAYANLALRTR